MARQLLIDSFSLKLNRLTEDKAGGEKYVFEGKFAQADKPTSNGRIYSRALWERELKRLSQKIKEGKVYGELDHPEDGKTKLQRSAVIIQSLSMDDQGQIIGRAKIMETSMGKELKAIADAGGSIGVSSRGYGSVQHEDGYNIVQDDFQLLTFDPVADPAEESAYPALSKEGPAPKGEDKSVDNVSPSKNEPTDDDEDTDDTKDDATDHASDAPKGNVSTNEGKDGECEKCADEDDDSDDYDDDEKKKEVLKGSAKESKKESKQFGSLNPNEVVKNQITNALNEQKKQFESKLLVAVKEAKANVREQLREELLSELMTDPKVAGAKTAMEQVKDIMRPFVLPEDTEVAIQGKEKIIKDLKEQLVVKEDELFESQKKVAQMTNAAKEMGFNLYLEKSLSDHPKFNQIVENIDFNKLGSLKDLKKRVAVHLEESQGMLSEKDEKISALKEMVGNLKSRCTKLEEKFDICKQELRETSKVALQNASRVYLERKITGNPYQAEIRKEFEKLESKSKRSVDQLVERFQVRRRSDRNDFSSVRNRLRAQGGGFKVSDESLVEDSVIDTFPENRDGEKKFSVMGESFDMTEVNRLAGISK